MKIICWSGSGKNIGTGSGFGSRSNICENNNMPLYELTLYTESIICGIDRFLWCYFAEKKFCSTSVVTSWDCEIGEPGFKMKFKKYPEPDPEPKINVKSEPDLDKKRIILYPQHWTLPSRTPGTFHPSAPSLPTKKPQSINHIGQIPFKNFVSHALHPFRFYFPPFSLL
jgi:hypothetical protein